jgi:hypothetical protein
MPQSPFFPPTQKDRVNQAYNGILEAFQAPMSTDPESPEVRTQVAKDTQKEVSIVDRTVQTLMNNTPLTGLGGGTFGLGGFVPQELIPEDVRLTGEEGIFEKVGDVLMSTRRGRVSVMR